MNPVPEPGLADRTATRPVVQRETRHVGAKWSLVTDEVILPGDVAVKRDTVVHPGAVAILALDDDDHVVLVRQYRHPVGAELWELPAGLLDEDQENPLTTAQRELFEEAHLRADQWDVLVDLYSSPGMSSEIVRIYLARGLSEVPLSERHVQTEEEQNMPSQRVPLQLACDLVLADRLHNAMSVAGLLAAAQARHGKWSSLRPADTPWPAPLSGRDSPKQR